MLSSDVFLKQTEDSHHIIFIFTSDYYYYLIIIYLPLGHLLSGVGVLLGPYSG